METSNIIKPRFKIMFQTIFYKKINFFNLLILKIIFLKIKNILF
jgi:hypothetical protein